MTNLSGAVQSALIAACRWLGLIDENGIPTQKLHTLVDSSDEEYPDALRSVLEESYSFLNEGFDLKNATGGQVAEVFRERFGSTGSTVTKCMNFFIKAAKEAGIQVSPHVKPPKINKGSGRASKKKAAAKRSNDQGAAPANQDAGEKPPKGMVKIPVPLHGMEDGQIWFQENMSAEQWSYALQMAQLILQHYRPNTNGDDE